MGNATLTNGDDNFAAHREGRWPIRVWRPWVIDGIGGNDTIEGGGDQDTLYGGQGNDNLNGGWDSDYLYGQEGDDLLRGDSFLGQGHDNLDGGAGNDNLQAGWGDDILIGGSGNDYLEGNDGDDDLIGGSGDDKLVGGSQTDWFVGVDPNPTNPPSNPGALEIDTLIGGRSEGIDFDTASDYFVLGDSTNVYYIGAGLVGSGYARIIGFETHSEVIRPDKLVLKGPRSNYSQGSQEPNKLFYGNDLIAVFDNANVASYALRTADLV